MIVVLLIIHDYRLNIVCDVGLFPSWVLGYLIFVALGVLFAVGFSVAHVPGVPALALVLPTSVVVILVEVARLASMESLLVVILMGG